MGISDLFFLCLRFLGLCRWLWVFVTQNQSTKVLLVGSLRTKNDHATSTTGQLDLWGLDRHFFCNLCRWLWVFVTHDASTKVQLMGISDLFSLCTRFLILCRWLWVFVTHDASTKVLLVNRWYAVWTVGVCSSTASPIFVGGCEWLWPMTQVQKHSWWALQTFFSFGTWAFGVFTSTPLAFVDDCECLWPMKQVQK